MLAGKNCVVFGFASGRSLAWGVADAWRREGATVAFALQSQRFRPALDKLTATWPAPPVVVYCDVTKDAEIEASCLAMGTAMHGRVDSVLHSIAYAPARAMRAPVLDCCREDFLRTLDVSVFSFIAISRGMTPFMGRPSTAETSGASQGAEAAVPAPARRQAASLLTLSYIGAARVVPNYGVMGAAKAALESTVRYLANELGSCGVRVNAISAGPLDTIASRGVPGFTDLKAASDARSPLRRALSLTEIGSTAVFLASDASAGVTGQILRVDCGSSILA